MTAIITDRGGARAEQRRRIAEKLERELGEEVLPLLRDPAVIEIVLNPDGMLWAERLGGAMRPVGSMSAEQAESLMATIAAALGAEITARNPILECELPLDGSRFEGMIRPVVAAPTFAIRKKAVRVFTLTDYLAEGIITQAAFTAIDRAVRARRNILVVGGTGSGKTTLTNAIIRHIVDVTPEDRIAIIEDTAELQCSAENAVTMRSNEQTDMTRLLKATMRLRPDRILVGEVRDGAALALLKAWNTGHPGGVATLHANSARAGLTRLEQLVGEVAPSPMPGLIAEAVDLVVFIERHGRSRCVREVAMVEGHFSEGYLLTQLGVQ